MVVQIHIQGSDNSSENAATVFYSQGNESPLPRFPALIQSKLPRYYEYSLGVTPRVPSISGKHLLPPVSEIPVTWPYTLHHLSIKEPWQSEFGRDGV
jgi:hypothetical protein